MKRTALLILFTSILLLVSCASMSDFYEEWVSPEMVAPECYLKDGEEPNVYYSNDIDSDLYYLRSNFYWIIGASGYNGPVDSRIAWEVSHLCKQKRATVGVYSYGYTNTKYGVTTIGSRVTSYSVDRYDYSVYLLVPMSEEQILYYARVGLSYVDLDSSDRLAQRRNTGARISVVYEGCPAFYANLSRGDIIIAVNGQEVIDASSLDRLFQDCTSGEDIRVTYLRDGVEREVTLKPLY